MKKFHRNLNIMSVFTAVLLILALIFWRTFLNIAITNIILNGIIIGTIFFGIGLCFVNMFKLLPEYNWMHAYFKGRANYGFSPKLLRPISLALRNKHLHISTSDLTELLDLVAVRIEEERDSVRYVTNTLIFLGLLGTFWGLIITVGGFAQILMNINFDSASVLHEMQLGMAGPLSGMATAFTSSLLGLAGSLIVGFLGLQLQFAQTTMFNELSDFMSQHILQRPSEDKCNQICECAPVKEDTYTKISEMFDSFTSAGYDVRQLTRLDRYPIIVAVGTHEQLFIATLCDDRNLLQSILKQLDLCFADTLDNIHINTTVFCVSSNNVDLGDRVKRFATTEALDNYLMKHPNNIPETSEDKDTFAAYAEYIDAVMEYISK
ncbi:MAG: hypothetical protein J6W08_03465 [Alphaproteobacteria bacterium]|nr:hypothetical protein [Alphaproteobacteria bacterium]